MSCENAGHIILCLGVESKFISEQLAHPTSFTYLPVAGTRSSFIKGSNGYSCVRH